MPAPSYVIGNDFILQSERKTVNLTDLPDGSCSAAAYREGTRFTEPIYYHKGNSVTGANGMTAHSLGTFRLTAYCPCRSCSEGWGKHTGSGAVKGKHIDIFFDTHDQTRQFGSRTAEVYLLQ